MAGENQTNLIEMRIADIRSLPAQEDRGERYCVVLEEVRGTTQLQIWIGSTEGTALAVALEKVELPRPMTYGLTSNLLKAVSTLVSEVRISKLVDDITYYAEILLEGPGGRVVVDARPSDALNLALLFGATIRVNAGVLQQAGQSNLSTNPQFRSTWYAEGSKGAAEIAAEITNNWYGPGRSLSQGPSRPAPPEGH